MDKQQTHSIDDVRTDINTFMSDYFESRKSQAAKLHDDYGLLWHNLDELHRAGGKRLRPYLFITTYEALGGSDYQQVLPMAAAIELLHSAMLIHDDVIDRDYVRHGADNLAGMYRQNYTQLGLAKSDANHYAASAAILGGDLMLSEAYQMIQESTVSDSQKLAATKLLGDAVYAVVGGELLDTEAALHPPERANSLQIAELKTAFYSCTTPLLLGALMADADSSHNPTLTALGTALGVAFQLTDDMLGVFGESQQTGKSVISDIREGKRTFLLQRTLGLASEFQLKKVKHIVGNRDCNEAMVAEVRDIMTACGARKEVENMIDEHLNRARQEVDKLPITASAQISFQSIIQSISRRAS